MAENTTIHPPGVVFYNDFYDAIKDLPEETVGKLMLALMRYMLFGEVPNFDPLMMTAWTFLRNYADRDRKRYIETVERRRAAVEKRWSRERTKNKAADPPAEVPAPKPAPQVVPTPPAQDEDEPPASIEWVRENILSGKNGEFVAGWAKKMYPELREKP